jgi:transcription initiation factor TFIIA small subunit
LKTNVKSRATLKGELNVYRFCDDVWTFVINSLTFKIEGESIVAEKVKIVACNSK